MSLSLLPSARWLVGLALLVGAVPAAGAQSHFAQCVSRTATSATIIIPDHVDSHVYGAPLEVGDEIAVFNRRDVCVGAVRWSGASVALTVWGDDSLSTQSGLRLGESLRFHVWDASERAEYAPANSRILVGFAEAKVYYVTEDRYVPNGIYYVDTFVVSEKE
jgi:hypothetical protein